MLKKLTTFPIVLLIFLIHLSGCSGQNSPVSLPELPKMISALPLVHTIQGTQANKFIYRMHGKTTGTRAHIVGYYGHTRKNILYLSVFETAEKGQKALVKMAEKINNGTSGFTPPEKLTVHDNRVYRTRGMGLDHFFYCSGPCVVWWQAEPDKSETTFKELYRYRFR